MVEPSGTDSPIARGPSSATGAGAFVDPRLSPSFLALAGTEASYELKFLVTPETAARIVDYASCRLSPDPFADPALGGAYVINSLYLDTPDLAVFHRRGSYARRKYRVRRYGESPEAFLERKTKIGERVAKRRVAVPLGEVDRLSAATDDAGWVGEWFRRRVAARGLGPVILVRYERVAFYGIADGRPVRLTLDRSITSAPHLSWDLRNVGASRPLLTGRVVLELKFRGAVPALFKKLMQEFLIVPEQASKYRSAIAVWNDESSPGRRGTIPAPER